MPENKMTRDALEARLQVAPFHRWLGLTLVEMDEEGITVGVTWREEFAVNPDRHYTHGGILASIIDTAADYAIAAKTGGPVPTVDLRVDYHRAAMPGDLSVRAEVIRLGGTVSTAEARVFDGDGKLVASGRGVYATGPARAG